MKKTIIVIIFMLFGISNLYAAQKVFLDKSTGRQIIDMSNSKTKESISREFNIPVENLDEVSIDQTQESVRVSDNKLVKYNFKEEAAQANEEKQKDKEKAIEKLKGLGLTDKEIKSLF